MLRVRLFGELRVEVDGREIEARGTRARAILAWLALNPGIHPRSRVAGRFWPDVLEESARGSLRRTLSDLRQALGPDGAEHLVAERDRIGLPDEAGVWVDAREFERLIAVGQPGDAIALCDGELLADLGDEWALEARDQHNQRLSALLGQLAGEALAAGHADDAVAFARRRAALDPLSEDAGRSLMSALAATGDRAGALAAFERLRERLAAELRLAPSVETRALAEEVRTAGAGPASAATSAPEADPEPTSTPAPPRPSTAAPLPRSIDRLAAGACVGRDAQLAVLRGAFERSRGGGRRVVVVAGEAGIGKTRLVAEACRRAHTDRATVLYGRCYENSVPYEAIVEALGAYVASGDVNELRSRAGPGAAELARLLPELSAPDASAAAVSDPDGARYRLFDAIDSLISSAPGQAPPVLAIDDVHWADPQTLALLRHLARSPAGSLLLLITFRLGEEASSREALSALLPNFRGADSVERITLSGLGGEAISDVVSLREAVEPTTELVAALERRTGGNPFFVEELLRRLDEAGLSSADQATAAITELELPEGVREVIERRLGRLAPRTRAALELASVLGREFTLELLEAVEGDGALLDSLEEAGRAELIQEAPGITGGYAFSHALVREVLYSGLSSARRVRLHRKIASTFERAGDRGAGDYVAEIARHLLAASPSGSDADRAALFASEAGDQAMDRLAYEDAAAAYEAALEAVSRAGDPDPDPRRRADLLVRLGEAKLRAAGTIESSPVFTEAAASARSAGAPELLGRAALGYGGLGVTILEVDEATLSLLEEAIDAIGDADTPLRARLLGRLAVELYYEHAERERGESLSAEAVDVAMRTGDEPAIAYALNARHVALWRPDRIDDRLELAREMIAVAEGARDRELELQGRNWLVTDLFEAGELAALPAEIDAYERIAADSRLPSYAWYGPLWRGALAAAAGRFDAAAELNAEALSAGEAAGDRNAETLCFSVTYVIAIMRDEFEAMREEAFRRAPPKLATSPAAPAWRLGLAHLTAAGGREDEARELFDEALPGGVAAALPFDVNWLDGLGLAAELCRLLDDAGRAAGVYELMLPFARRHLFASGRSLVTWGAAERHLGVLASILGRWDDAERHFDAALADNARLGFEPWVAWTRYQYASMLIERARPADRKRAAELLAAAAELARELGLSGLERRIAAATSASASP